MRRRAPRPLWLAAAAAIVIATPLSINASQPALVDNARIHASADAAARARIEAATTLTFERLREWLGPPPFASLTIGEGAAADAGTIAVAPRAANPPGLMAIESAVAFGIAERWLARIEQDDLRSGLAWYLQSRIVERLFDLTFLGSGYQHEGTCFFACFVQHAFPSLVRDRFGAGLGRDLYLRQLRPRAWPPVRPAIEPAVARAAMVFASLERELGWPTLQGALKVAATSATADIAGVVSDATARDLRAVFTAAFETTAVDYRISALTSEPASCASSSCYVSKVMLAPVNNVVLPLTLRIEFADGQHAESYWRGEAMLGFESTTPAVAARLDPDRVWLLDPDYANNARVGGSPTNVPVGKWIARWIVWLQDAMLAYSFPV